jgi:hypothetical protein
VVPEVRIIEIPRPVIRPIPEKRIEPLPVPVLPAGADNEELSETLGQCTDQLHRSNLDRAWLRDRQTKGEVEE